MTSDICGKNFAISSIVFDSLENRHQRGNLIKQVFLIAKQRVAQKVFREERIDWRRLRAGTAQTIVLHDGEFGRPISAPTHAVNRESGLVDLRTALRVIDDLRQHSVGMDTDFDGCLPRPGAVDRQEIRRHRAESPRNFPRDLPCGYRVH